MAFQMIVEDGTCPANANSYVTQAYADDYFDMLNNQDWSGEDEDKQKALVQATQAIDLLYGQEYISFPTRSQLGDGPKQNLYWPRITTVVNHIQIINSTQIPTQLKQAVCEIALLALNDEEILPTPNNRASISSEMVKVGDIQTQSTYGHNPEVERFAGFWKIDKLLAPILACEDGDHRLYL